MKIRARAPLRLGLAGGGTDLAVYSDIYGGCVLNATIDRYVYASLEENNENMVEFVSSDLRSRETLPCSAAPFVLDTGLKLHRAVYNYFIKTYNNSIPVPLTIHTLAEAPAGSGLGTSSTLVVALCRVFDEYFRVGIDEYDIAQLAYIIEREHCGFAGGKQDQYTAAFGGVNFMEFMTSGKTLVNPLRIKRRILNEFEASLLLYFTGVSRESDKIIRAQAKNITDISGDALNAMHETKQEAYAMKASLLKGDFPALIDSFRRGWASKKRMAPEITNSGINRLYDDAIAAGADAAKISGAGGGGFMMLLVQPDRRADVIRTLEKAGGIFFPAHFTDTGVETWSR